MNKFFFFVFFSGISFSTISQVDEKFLSSIYKDFIPNNCDSFLLLIKKEEITITKSIKFELKKYLPKKAVKEICKYSKLTNNSEWDMTKLNFAHPVNQDKKHLYELKFYDDLIKANQTFNMTYGLDTISNYAIRDSLENSIVRSGITVFDFSKILPCYRQMFIFSRPLFSKNCKYAIIAFTNYRWKPYANGYIAICENKEGEWIQIAKINNWIS